MPALQHPWQRHDLVWLTPSAWHRLCEAPWDEQASQILTHWCARDLPVVVARQREGAADRQLCLGLPAPLRWGRRRLALEVVEADIARAGAFPLLSDVVPQTAVKDARVYGSYGWQALTGLDYVHADSDLDVLAAAEDLPQAQLIAERLHAWSAPHRVDGEVVMPGGHAVAWRELWLAMQAVPVAGTAPAAGSPQVLVKHRISTGLMTLEALNATCHCV